VRSLSGEVTSKRNYHYCEACEQGFYPVDRLLDLPEQGELTSEMEKRVLDFAVNDVYGKCEQRWALHYRDPISENLLRRVVARVGAQCEAADQLYLQEELKPKGDAPKALVIEVDGSMLPIRGAEAWNYGDPAQPRLVPGIEEPVQATLGVGQARALKGDRFRRGAAPEPALEWDLIHVDDCDGCHVRPKDSKGEFTLLGGRIPEIRCDKGATVVVGRPAGDDEHGHVTLPDDALSGRSDKHVSNGAVPVTTQDDHVGRGRAGASDDLHETAAGEDLRFDRDTGWT